MYGNGRCTSTMRRWPFITCQLQSIMRLPINHAFNNVVKSRRAQKSAAAASTSFLPKQMRSLCLVGTVHIVTTARSPAHLREAGSLKKRAIKIPPTFFSPTPCAPVPSILTATITKSTTPIQLSTALTLAASFASSVKR